MNDEQPILAPCGHPRSENWDGCDWCAADFVDRRGGHPLGRHQLLGLTAGLALDLRDDGRVIAYMLHADTVAGDSGGWRDAWITHDEWLSQAPDVEITAPAHYLPPEQTAEELADFCELVSGLATTLRPVVERAIELDALSELYDELGVWVEKRQMKRQARRLVFAVAQVLLVALTMREDQVRQL